MARHDWAPARYTIVNKASKPGQIERAGNANSVAAIELAYGADGQSLVIEGPPQDLVSMARQILAAAEEIVVETMRDPELRSLYALPDPANVPTTSHAGGMSIMPRLS